MAYMRSDCEAGLAEGFSASTRAGLELQNRNLIASLNVVDDNALAPGDIGLSKIALQRLQAPVVNRISVYFGSGAQPVRTEQISLEKQQACQ